MTALLFCGNGDQIFDGADAALHAGEFLAERAVEDRGDFAAQTDTAVGAGDFAVANSTGSFAQYNNSFGLIKSINNFTQPLNTPISLPNSTTAS